MENTDANLQHGDFDDAMKRSIPSFKSLSIPLTQGVQLQGGPDPCPFCKKILNSKILVCQRKRSVGEFTFFTFFTFFMKESQF